jgi:hypothetical protein
MRRFVNWFTVGALGALLVDWLWNWSAKECPWVQTRASRAWDATESWTGGGCDQ